MKKIRIILLCISMACWWATVPASSLIEKAGFPSGKPIFKSIIEEKEEQLRLLKQEAQTLEKEKDTTLKNIKSDIQEYKNKREQVQKELASDPRNEFLSKKLLLETETLEVLNALQRVWENNLKKITDHSAILDKYLKDVEFKEYTKNLKMAGPYFFEDLEDVYQKIASKQTTIDQLRKKRENVIKDQKAVNSQLEKATEEYKDKKNKQDELSKAPKELKESAAPFALLIEQRAELLALEVNAAKLKKELLELQVKEKKYELAWLDTELFIENAQYEILQDVHRTIKSSITITDQQLDSARQELEKKIQQFSLLKTQFSQEIDKLRQLNVEEKKQLEVARKRYSVPLGTEFDTWSWQPKKTLESYIGLCKAGMLNTSIRLLEDKEKYNEYRIVLEQEKINYSEQLLKIKTTYYKVIAKKYAAEDEITKEITDYTQAQTNYDTAIRSYKAKKEELENELLKVQNELLEKLKKQKLDVSQQKEAIFKNNLRDFSVCLTNFQTAESYVTQRITILADSIKTLSEIIAALEKVSGYNRFILTELQAITIWYRPEYAISWHGVASIGKDIKLFFADVGSYLKQFNTSMLKIRPQQLVQKPLALIFFLLKSLIIFGLLLLARRYKLLILMTLSNYAVRRPHFGFLLQLMGMIIGYLATYAYELFFVIFGLRFVVQFLAPDPYILIVLYMLAIPYGLLMAYYFINYLISFNKSCNYCLISADFVPRFTFILATFLYSTIVLTLFRYAFMLAKIPKSELATILLAINFIIFQACIIFLLSKEQILGIIPTSFEFGARLYRWIDRYYYVLLLLVGIVIVMSNPYIGYGQFVIYIMQSLILTLILIRLLMWAHALIKKSASQLFFYTEEEVAKERFAYSKTWFGLSIIFSFIMLSLLGIFFGSHIWEKIWGAISLTDIYKWLHVPLLGIGKGTLHPLTAFTIITLILFIVSGFLLAFAINHFVLEKIFDLMLVDVGAQQAITNLLRYFLITVAIVLGLQSVGYGALLSYLFALLLAIGYLVQNPLQDLIAYFILLMQRPIKIGDYIKVDEEIIGVVRKITPKSVVIRRKNSMTIIVPNSQIINKAVVNWNYTRNFIAFDDITITISYQADPAKARDLLISVLINHPNILKNPKPIVRLDDFNDRGFYFTIRGFISANATLEKHEIASEIRLAIIKILRDNNIEIALPVRVIASSGQQLLEQK